MTCLYIFSGLPATGKTSLAQRLAGKTGACFLRIDTIEQGLRDLGRAPVRDEGYCLAYRIAADNLILGNDVIADACNPIDLTREAWQRVALDAGAGVVTIEIICSDPDEHRFRAEQRKTSVPGLVLPDWDQILNREYHPWTSDVIRIDTAGKGPDQSFQALWKAVGRQHINPGEEPWKN